MPFSPASFTSVAAFLCIVIAILAFFIWSLTQITPELRARNLRLSIFALMAWICGFWIFAESGLLIYQPMPAIPIFFALMLVSCVVFAFSSFGSKLALQLPLAALVGFQAFRLPLELVLHSWVGQGTIPETMSWTGQNFDILTGILALLMIPLVHKSKSFVWFFNTVGFLLLLNVMRVALFSSALPFAWGVQPPLQLVSHTPYFLIGPVCVGGALVVHLLLFRRLFSGRP